MKGFEDRDRFVQKEAVKSLMRIGSRDAIYGLEKALAYPDNSLRRISIIALGKIDTYEAALCLVKVIENSDNKTRQQAAETLGKRGKSDVLDELMEILRDPKQPVQETASETLCKIVSMSTSVPVLVKALGASSRDVRKVSIEALWKIGTPEAVSGLLRAWMTLTGI